ncbi:MAG: PilZ domain-containing protein [Nitrospira defluvii]|nr:PilZ domain-containing protein [Nitrospira defluvii]
MHQKVYYQVSLSTTSAAAGEGKLVDLSVEGCRMECARELSVNTYLSLRLLLASEEPPILVDLAAVRWVRDKECGIHFLSIQPLQANRLKIFLAPSDKPNGPPESTNR